jgi:hypothetical protein
MQPELHRKNLKSLKETVAVEETVLAIETATTEAAIVIMPKSEVVAAAPGVKQMTEKMRLLS